MASVTLGGRLKKRRVASVEKDVSLDSVTSDATVVKKEDVFASDVTSPLLLELPKRCDEDSATIFLEDELRNLQ